MTLLNAPKTLAQMTTVFIMPARTERYPPHGGLSHGEDLKHKKQATRIRH